MTTNFKQFIDDNFAYMKQDLLALVAHESVEGTATAACPFGDKVGAALDTVADIAQTLGLKNENHSGYYVTVDLGDVTQPGQAVGILTHADVVPIGEGWNYNPLGQFVGSRIYGRGTLDDKGPTVATLYAIAAIKASGLPLARPVRLIVGGNEESGSRCILKYSEENLPLWGGFSPDGDFPVIFAEKGIAIHKSDLAVESNIIQSITAGTTVNAVPGKAEAVISDIKLSAIEEIVAHLPNPEKIGIEQLNDGNLKITAVGKSAHGSTPERGDSAIARLLAVLTKLSDSDPLISALQYLDRFFCHDHYGIAAGIATEDEISGKLTLNLGVLNYTKGNMHWELDLRYPVTKNYDEIKNQLDDKLAAANLHITCDEHKEPLYVPKDSPLVQTLAGIYAATGKQDTEPLAIGGGTYCRAMENFVAFGPLSADDVNVMHQADEYIEQDHLRFLAHIYADAIYQLAK